MERNQTVTRNWRKKKKRLFQEWRTIKALVPMILLQMEIPLALLTRIFLKEQGHASETTICQDNTAAVLLEKNGKESSSKRTRHTNIMCFFIKDCIDKGCPTVEHCPTDK